MDEGLFPHSRSANSPDELEEERRLCYVGMTRARDTLTLTRANFRRTFGSELNESAQPSRFLSEIPTDLIDVLAGSLSEAAGDGRRYVSDPEFDDYSGRRGYAGRGGYGASRWSRQSGSGSRTGAGASSTSAAPARARTNPLIGMRVRHPKYGVGTVLSVEGDDEDRRLTISFPDYGTKKLVERYANLVRE
jgi:DNA helicase-2/ATP-dependent DNA helicase PcrA